jgi:hypothetical protein
MAAVNIISRTDFFLFPFNNLAVFLPASFVSRKKDNERIKTIPNPIRLFQPTLEISFKSRVNDEFLTMSSNA